MSLFHTTLLGTSRVIWPAAPATLHTRITIRASSRLAVARGYLALLAYPGGQEDAARAQLTAALEEFTAALVEPGARPAELRHLPRRRALLSALRPGLKRLERARQIAARWPFEPGEAAAVLAPARTARRVETAAPIRPRDVLRREIGPVLPVIHLGLALVAARRGVAELELAPRGIPERPADLITSADWPFVALDAAERWRQALADPGLIEVRARWI